MAFGAVVMGSAVSAIVGIIALVIYLSIYTTLNLDLFIAGDRQMLAIIPTLLVAVIVVSILVGGFSFVMGGS